MGFAQFCERRSRTMPNSTPSSETKPVNGNCMMHARFVTVLLAAFAMASPIPLAAEEKAPQPGQHPVVVVGDLAAISIAPETVVLSGKRARQQLIVTGQYATGELRYRTPP